MSDIIGIDIGGTKTAIGVVDNQGQIKQRKTIPTDLTVSPDTMLERIGDAVEALERPIGDVQIKGIGIGAPGPLDPDQGRMLGPPNLPTWHNLDVSSYFHERFQWPVELQNDAVAALFAERWTGAAKGCEDVVYLTISTGIGSGIISGGRLIKGVSGNAGEVGHIVIDPSFGECVCGQKGCFEYIASGTGISNHGSRALGETLSAEEIFSLARSGNQEAAAFLDKIYAVMGAGCVTLVNSFDPERIVIGGGVSKAGGDMFEAIQSYVSRYALNERGRAVSIVPASHGTDAGLIGAAAQLLLKGGEAL